MVVRANGLRNMVKRNSLTTRSTYENKHSQQPSHHGAYASFARTVVAWWCGNTAKTKVLGSSA